MKLLFQFILCTIIAFPVSAQTQRELEEEAHQTYLQTDSILQALYQDILISYASNTSFIENLKVAQFKWTENRDAQIDFILQEFYGSYQFCKLGMLTDFAKERITFLEQWTIGVEEGDVCMGSRALKEEKINDYILTESTIEGIQQEIILKEAIQQLQLGDTYDAVRKKIGNPDNSTVEPGPYDEVFVTWNYKELGLACTFYVDYMTRGTITLTEIKSTSTTTQTNSGLKVGDSIDKILQLYKGQIGLFYSIEDLNSMQKDETYKLIIGEMFGIQYTIQNGRISEILLSSYWGPRC